MSTTNSDHHRHRHDRRPNSLYIDTTVADQPINSGDCNSGDDSGSFEMMKFDLWNTGDDDHPIKPISKTMAISIKLPLKPHRCHQRKIPVAGKSLPINIPDWSKILRDAYQRSYAGNDGEDDEDDGRDEWLPPHEYLARTRIASFSVHEGVGRTLKGRDLSRLRNAIWKQTGFEQD